jgi:NodT family efflux transporter outer membrane factor (OMF) lipoprotein
MTRRLLMIALVPFLASCAVGPRYRPPTAATPSGWREAPSAAIAETDRVALERWWTAFHDPVLDDLVIRAVAGNRDLKIAAARVRESRAARGIAASAALPRADAAGNYTRAERSDMVPPFKAPGLGGLFGARTQNLFEAGFDAGWELDVFGGVTHDVEAAIAQVQAAEESRRDVLVTLVADVARNYAELRGAQRQLQILDATVASQRESRDIARARFEAGLETALDVERAEGLLADTTSRRPDLDRSIWRAAHRIGVLLGQPPAALARLIDAPADSVAQTPEIPATLPSELLSRRPDLRRAEREVAAATAQIGVARADLYPRFAISGTFGRRSADAADLRAGASQFWSIVPGVRWPILSGGRIRANIRVHDARLEQSLNRYEQAVLVALEGVEDALLAQSREQHRLETLRESVRANRRALELATERYTGGLENFLSVLDAQRALYAAEAALADSETRAMVNMIAVYKSLGGGWTPDSTPQDQ